MPCRTSIRPKKGHVSVSRSILLLVSLHYLYDFQIAFKLPPDEKGQEEQDSLEEVDIGRCVWLVDRVLFVIFLMFNVVAAVVMIIWNLQ